MFKYPLDRKFDKGVRKAFKKPLNPSACSYPGGGVREPALTPPYIFFSCFKPTCLVLGSPKTNFVFTPNSISHLFFDFIDHQN